MKQLLFSMRSVAAVLFVLIILASGTTAQGDQVVLFDQGHGQRFLVEKGGPLDLSSFAALFAEAGFVVQTSRSKLTREILNKVDVLVISGAFRPVVLAEAKVVDEFIRGGGKLIVLIHIHQPYFVLFEQLGIAVSRYPLREQNNTLENNPLDFLVRDIQDHPVTAGLQSFSLYGCWGLKSLDESLAPLASTSQAAWMDVDGNNRPDGRDGQGPYPVLLAGKLGMGSVALFGDDALFQNTYLKGNNLRLANNLVNWLCCRDVSI